MSETRLVNLALLKKRLSPEIFTEFCTETGLCPQCLTETLTISQDDLREIVCRTCGLVLGQEPSQSHSLPGVGRDTNYSDCCELSFGRNLGSHIRKFTLYSILKKGPSGVKDLGIRRIRLLNATKIEKSSIELLLRYGSQLCKQYHLDGKDRTSVQFANEFGKLLRLCGKVALALTSGTIGSKRLAYACFSYLYAKQFHNGTRIRQQLDVSDEALNWVDRVAQDVALPKGIEIFRKKTQGLPDPYCVDDLPVLKLEPHRNKRDHSQD